MSTEPKADLLPHQQRVIEERRDLEERLSKLRAFIGTPLYDQQDKGEKLDLLNQACWMINYLACLDRRIARFTEAAA